MHANLLQTETMEILAFFNGKGGVGKSTLTPPSAAAIKKLFPGLKVGVIAADSDQRSLSWAYTPDYENEDRGLWNVIEVMLDRRTAKDPVKVAEVINAAVRRIRVIPDVPEEDGTIEFMSCAGELGKRFCTLPEITSPHSYENVGAPLFNAIRDVLEWDICILDLPGSIKDSLVMTLLPVCTSVVIVSDCVKVENLSMEEEVVAQVKALKVQPMGFLANKVGATAISKDAVKELKGAISTRTQVPVVAEVRDLPTIAIANRCFAEDGQAILPTGKWHMPKGGLHVGFYVQAADPRKNSSTRNAILDAALEIEEAVLALLQNCHQDVPKFRKQLEQHRAEFERKALAAEKPA